MSVALSDGKCPYASYAMQINGMMILKLRAYYSRSRTHDMVEIGAMLWAS